MRRVLGGLAGLPVGGSAGLRARGVAALLIGGIAALLIGVPGIADAAPGPSGAPQYWFDDWGAPSLWAAGARGQGITIAEIDTGVNAQLPELRGKILAGKDFGQRGDGRVDREISTFGHGTAMASIMVARAGLLDITGLAPDAKVLPIAVPLDGTTDAQNPDQLPDAIRYAANHGAKIISMSLGGRRSPQSDPEACPADEQLAIFEALRKGAVVVAAVGNTGQRPNTVVEPGVCLGVVAVGAVDAAGTVAPFSSREPYVTLTAPGVGIASLSRVAGRAYAGAGTSQATALTAAGLALVWSKYPRLTGQQVVARVLATLDRAGASPRSAYGYGRLDVGTAVTARLPVDLPNPVYATARPFLARAAALMSPTLGPAPKAAARPGSPGGGYSVGTNSRVWTHSVVFGGVLALAGLLLLVGLLVAAARIRRRRSAAADTPTPLPEAFRREPADESS